MYALLALALTAASPLSAARAHLAAHNPDLLAMDLSDDVTLAEAERPAAAELLVQGSKLAQKKKDRDLALLLAQMAHRRDGQSTPALAQLCELARADQQYGEAEKWADAWRKLAPQDVHATLARLRVAGGEGDWDTVRELASALDGAKGLTRPEQREVKSLAARAGKDSGTLTTTSALEQRLKLAEELAAQDRSQALAAQERPADPGVTVYGTSWCGYCKKARAYFKSKGIAFADKDIEADKDAAEELAQKAQEAGIHPTGVPVIDVHGTLVEGFDRARIEQLLSAR